MGVRFGDLYDDFIAIEQSTDRIRQDIDNAECDSATRCVLSTELGSLEQKYNELSETKIDFAELNFVTLIESVERCMYCIEFDEDCAGLLDPPTAVASACGAKDTLLTLDDFERIIIHEVTTQTTTYDFIKSAMPYTITTRAKEKYVVSWDSCRKGISVKCYNTTADKSVTGFGNITKVEIVLTENARNRYSATRVRACKVLLTTPTPMLPSAPLTRAVDNQGDAPIIAQTSETQAELVFQFFV
ncbi:hypothetical protein [Metabacillus fastidiosus]|uniref:hypothetical protein n=1 Tax=Metabacillus fastidiosus TaxID=1458 RepID=UPI003D2AE164